MTVQDSTQRTDSELNLEVQKWNRFRRRVFVAFGPFFVLAVLFTDQHRALPDGIPEALAAVLIAGALTLRLWALGAVDCYKKIVLVTWGPYRYLRHPLYLGSCLFVFGVSLLTHSFVATAALLTTFIALHLPVVRAEERLLEARFGPQWESYHLQVPMVIPKLRPGLATTPQPFFLRRPARDFGALFLLALAAFGVFGLRHIHLAAALPDWFH